MCTHTYIAVYTCTSLYAYTDIHTEMLRCKAALEVGEHLSGTCLARLGPWAPSPVSISANKKRLKTMDGWQTLKRILNKCPLF